MKSHSKIGKIFASAGCGKTTALLNLLDSTFKEGTDPRKVLFSTFTRAGAYEARDRAVEKFNLPEESFLYFRTLHSLSYRAIGGPMLMSRADYKTLGKTLHCYFGSAGFGEEIGEIGKGDALLSLYNLQRNLLSPENLIPEEYGVRASKAEYDHFIRTYDNYRHSRGLYDYTDMLEQVVEDGIILPISHAFIDEAQDLTQLQLKVVKSLSMGVERIWYAGDDDQCIFEYSGADPSLLIDMKATEQVVLEKSYRLPVQIAGLANKIAHKLTKREPKTITSYHEDSGTINHTNNLLGAIVPDEPTVVLVRNRVFLSYLEEIFMQKGIIFDTITKKMEELDRFSLAQARKAVETWEAMLDEPDTHFRAESVKKVVQYIPKPLLQLKYRQLIIRSEDDETFSYNTLVKDYRLVAQAHWETSLDLIPHEIKEYLRTLCREKVDLASESNIRIGTIHSFKGKEEDHVIIMPDMTYRTWAHYEEKPDQEHRVFYVGVTRAKKKLTICDPITKYYYNW